MMNSYFYYLLFPSDQESLFTFPVHVMKATAKTTGLKGMKGWEAQAIYSIYFSDNGAHRINSCRSFYVDVYNFYFDCL